MKSSASKIKLSSFDDLFETDSDKETIERIMNISLEKLIPFANHPFKVSDDEKMEETRESISKYGVLVPIIVRPSLDGNYEIVSGHR
ncbi:MAG: ParB N-terminal domain-containing protein, partial [Coprobacillaceae bacterium]